MLKKLSTILLAFMLVIGLAFVGCGNNKEDDDTGPAPGGVFDGLTLLAPVSLTGEQSATNNSSNVLTWPQDSDSSLINFAFAEINADFASYENVNFVIYADNSTITPAGAT